jgi:NAD(P)-dependent dehydrogenase (short-subunit alcohol dehydrogenase family)
MSTPLQGKVALVTGASRGLGKAMALALARAGADVVVAARTTEAGGVFSGTIHETAGQVTALGRRALSIRCDVTKDDQVEAMARGALAEFGRVDILVNNAGVGFVVPVAEMPVKRWDLVLAVNLRGTVLCSKALLPGMMERRSGSIINISSVLARRSVPGWAAYSTSKAAIDRFTVSLAEEVKGYNIAVNSLSPAATVDTEGLTYVTKATPEEKADWATTEAMERAAVYLAGLDADTFTGQVVTDQELLGWRDLHQAQRK